MNLKLARALLLSSLSISGTYSSAAPLCQYAAFTPNSMRQFLDMRLAEFGIAAVPSTMALVRGQEKDELFLAKDGQGYGYLKLNGSALTGTTTLVVLDAARKEIARSQEKIWACGSGVCRQTDITMTIGGAKGTLGISQFPHEGVRYLINQQYADSSPLWFNAFDDYVEEIMKAFDDDSRRITLSPPTRAQRLTVKLATDRTISPYLSLLRLWVDSSGRLVLSGRTNFTIYGLIMETALNAGLFLKPEVILDSGIRFDAMLPSQDLMHCVRP